MPCYLVVTILLADHASVEKAAGELGLVEGKDYTWNKGVVTLSNPRQQNVLKQRYGVVQSESLARRKGYKVQRKVQEDGAIQLRLTR